MIMQCLHIKSSGPSESATPPEPGSLVGWRQSLGPRAPQPYGSVPSPAPACQLDQLMLPAPERAQRTSHAQPAHAAQHRPAATPTGHRLPESLSEEQKDPQQGSSAQPSRKRSASPACLDADRMSRPPSRASICSQQQQPQQQQQQQEQEQLHHASPSAACRHPAQRPLFNAEPLQLAEAAQKAALRGLRQGLPDLQTPEQLQWQRRPDRSVSAPRQSNAGAEAQVEQPLPSSAVTGATGLLQAICILHVRAWQAHCSSCSTR